MSRKQLKTPGYSVNFAHQSHCIDNCFTFSFLCGLLRHTSRQEGCFFQIRNVKRTQNFSHVLVWKLSIPQEAKRFWPAVRSFTAELLEVESKMFPTSFQTSIDLENVCRLK